MTQPAHRPSHTTIGTIPTRLPAGEARERLADLALRGVRLCQRDRSMGGRLITYICDSLYRALVDLANMEIRARDAENRHAAANRRIALLEHQLADAKARIDAESFDVKTTRHEDSELLQKARRTAVGSVSPGVR